jgi:hypothetical protein
MLRFWNNDVLANIGGVLETILAALQAQAPPHRRAIADAARHDAPAPAPRLRGEGRGEGAPDSREFSTPSPEPLRGSTSPRKRGEVQAAAICNSPAPSGER